MIEFSLSESAAFADSRIIEREAVRAVIFLGHKLLMIHSPVKGDYKFPGGGINRGETGEEALRREVREECGIDLTTVGRKIGLVREERPAAEEAFDHFIMTSAYYLCTVSDGEFEEQRLDDYEAELKFTPVWITPEEALAANKAVLAENSNPPPWTKREVRFLQKLIGTDS